MKTIIKIVSICILASVILASCRSKTSVIKRHYNKGYYITHSKTNTTKAKNTTNSPQAKAMEPVQTKEDHVEQIVINKTHDTVSAMNTDKLVASNTELQEQLTSTSDLKRSLNYKSFHIKHRSAEVNKASEEAIGNASSDDDDGLSLFGFVILLILILWALGFFVGGIGWFIHILLVVALVLLILWLLRII